MPTVYFLINKKGVFAMFGKKKKMTEEEREQQLDNAEAKMKKSIANLESLKKTYFMGLMQARQKKLALQEKRYRGALARCIAQIHMQEGALMDLQLMRTNKDFSESQSLFMDSVMMISNDIERNYKKTDVKKVENARMKINFTVGKQEEDLERVLRTGEMTDDMFNDNERYQEYGNEIDSMIESVEGPLMGSNGNRQRQ